MQVPRLTVSHTGPKTLYRFRMDLKRNNTQIQHNLQAFENYVAIHNPQGPVLNRHVLKHAMTHPDLYTNSTVRVKGYCIEFIRVTETQHIEMVYGYAEFPHAGTIQEEVSSTTATLS
jgi:Glycine radical